jgi:hypothetical protein
MILVLCSLLCSLGYYVQSYKTGLKAKRWALAGLLFGPMLYPLFRSRQRMSLVEARGPKKGLFSV